MGIQEIKKVLCERFGDGFDFATINPTAFINRIDKDIIKGNEDYVYKLDTLPKLYNIAKQMEIYNDFYTIRKKNKKNIVKDDKMYYKLNKDFFHTLNQVNPEYELKMLYFMNDWYNPMCTKEFREDAHEIMVELVDEYTTFKKIYKETVTFRTTLTPKERRTTELSGEQSLNIR